MAEEEERRQRAKIIRKRSKATRDRIEGKQIRMLEAEEEKTEAIGGK